MPKFIETTALAIANSFFSIDISMLILEKPCTNTEPPSKPAKKQNTIRE
jgi:hypothetical protein